MAHVPVSDEQYQSLTAIAHQRGVTPERLIAALIELLEREDQLAFWGEGIVENLQRQMAETDQPKQYLSPEKFFAELDAVVSSKEANSADADV
jgi:hypothetical protein